MQPVRQLLGSTRSVLLSPDGNLNLIPFEALVDEHERYLLENYSFTYLTSGRDLLRLSEHFPSQTSPMLLGSPDFEHSAGARTTPDDANSLSASLPHSIDLSKWDFSPLPGTPQEVKEIAAILEVESLLYAQATEEALKQVNSPTLLHIATHGFFESAPTSEVPTLRENPLLLSGLVLAGFKPQSSEQRKPTHREDGVSLPWKRQD